MHEVFVLLSPLLLAISRTLFLFEVFDSFLVKMAKDPFLQNEVFSVMQPKSLQMTENKIHKICYVR